MSLLQLQEFPFKVLTMTREGRNQIFEVPHSEDCQQSCHCLRIRSWKQYF